MSFPFQRPPQNSILFVATISPPPQPHSTCGQGAIIIMRRVVNGNPVSYNAEGAQAFSIICSYVLKVAQLAFCLSVTDKNSFFCVADPDPDPDPERI
jgi:hypothetical protein